MYFSFLENYIIAPKFYEEKEARAIGRTHHFFYALPEYQIQEAINTFRPFPEELKTLYCEIGFGFMHRAKSGKFNFLFDPMTLIYTNNQINYFATPETIAELQYYDVEKQLLFFKSDSNSYLAIDRCTVHGKNKIYYQGITVDDSLHDFMKHLDYNSFYLSQFIEIISYEQEKKVKKQEKVMRKEEEKQREKVKYLGGHRLLDKD